MIKCNKGSVEIEGKSSQVLAELSVLVRVLYRDCFMGDSGFEPEEAKAEIMYAVERAFMTDEESKEEAKDSLKEIIHELGDLLKDILSGKDDE